MMRKRLLYIPNVIDYLRFVLVLMSWVTYYSHPFSSAALYTVSISLDGVDGYLARKLKQQSEFGAWLDVVVDNIGRGMIWCRLYHFGFLVAALEWLTFVCTHQCYSEWKTPPAEAPVLVKAVMAHNFKSLWGFIAVGSLHVLPLWLYCHYSGVFIDIFIPMSLQYVGIGLLASGRSLCMLVELWFVYNHILCLLNEEARAAVSRTNKELQANH
ncbi:hypothetical protein NP493_542g00015 [Ridgeia piscesae]|uniref:CDP-diacylglycerol--inositol 3-phosphatidyltransferase n=1 Tax=Ridgeia piscesae TaxID=27915 RepID=A0AAD9NS11_RIDPI|nr:hypothetical protein NP493_542g00015 [Ridgeia piscesae]